MRKYLLPIISTVFAHIIIAQQEPTNLQAMREKARAIAMEKAAKEGKSWEQMGTATKIKALKEARMAALQDVQKKQSKQYGIIKRSLTEIERQVEPDLFTQSEAHLQVPDVLKKMSKMNSDTFIPYLNIIADALSREAEFKNTHYVFYHGVDNEWRVPQDLYTQLYTYIKPEKKVEDFIFLRFNGENGGNAQDFLIQQMEKYGLPDDTKVFNKPILLSVNVSLFGNIGFPKECSWEYFRTPQSHKEPRKELYIEILDNFGFSDKYLDILLSFYKEYQTDEQSLLQIFVPKELVDEIGYIAWHRGVPAYSPLIEEIKRQQKKESQKTTKEALKGIKTIFKSQKMNNGMYRTILENIRIGQYKISSFLKIMCNNPWAKEINDISARLIFTPDVLLNPYSGVKIYRYTTMNRKKSKEYREKFDAIIKKIVEGKKI